MHNLRHISHHLFVEAAAPAYTAEDRSTPDELPVAWTAGGEPLPLTVLDDEPMPAASEELAASREMAWT